MNITPRNDSDRTTPNPLVGVRGWLAFYCTVLIVINPLVTFYSFYSAHQSIELLRKYGDLNAAQFLETFSLSFGVPSFVLAMIGITAGILLISRSQNAVMVAKIHTATVPSLSVLALVASFGVQGSPEMKGALIGSSVLGAIKSLGYFAIWFTYLCRSRRVRETYRDDLNNEQPEAGTVHSDGETVIHVTESLPLPPPLQETRSGKEEERGKTERTESQARTDKPTSLDLGNPEHRTKPCMYYLYCKGEQRGPYAMDQVRSMWASGIVTADSLYWNEAEQGWKLVTELFAVKAEPFQLPPIEHKSPESIDAAKVVPPPLPPDEQKRPEAPDIGKADETSENLASSPSAIPSDMGAWDSVKPHPWRRLWARWLDLQILGGIPASIVAPILFYYFPQIPLSNYFFVFGFAFATGLESWLLAKYGTTPAKYLFGMSVREANGEKLTPIHAGQRTRSAVSRAIIPLWLLFAGPLAYSDLKTNGATKWDRKNGFLVTSSRIGAARWLFAIALCAVFVLSFSFGIFEIFDNAARMDKKHRLLIFPSFSVTPALLPASSANVSDDPDYKAARVAEEAHDNDAMLKYAKILIGRYPNSTLALKCLSDAYFYADSQQEALTAINKAIQIEPKDIVAWHDLGAIRKAMKQLPKAEDAFKQGLKLEPNEPLLLADLGGVQIDLGQKENALRSTEQAQQSLSTLPFDSHNGELREELIWSSVADNYRDLEQWPKAILALKHATMIKPRDAELWSQMGAIQYKADIDGAIMAFQRSIDIAPNAHTYNWLALCWSKKNDRAKTIDSYKNAIRCDPNNADAWSGLGTDYYYDGKIDEAITALQRSIDIAPVSDAYYHLALCWMKKNDDEKVADACKQAVKYDPNNAEAWLELGALYDPYFERNKQLGTIDDSIAAYEQVTKLTPNNGYAWCYLGSVYTRRGRFADAATAYAQADKISPGIVQEFKQNHRSQTSTPAAQSSSSTPPPAQSKSDVQREFARQITPLMFPDGENGNSALGKAITREIARLKTAENGELYSEDAPLSITGRMADSLGIKPLMTVDAASSIVFARWKKIRTDAQTQAQSSSDAQPQAKSKFDVQREFATQISILMFPECPKDSSPLGEAITREIARLRAVESGELYSEEAPLSITGRIADSLGIKPVMTVEEASSIVFTRWKKIRTDAAK